MAKTPTKTESSNVAETNIADTSKTSTSTVVDGLPNLTETQTGSPAAMPLQNGEPTANGGLVSQDENASRTENVNASSGNGAAIDAQSQGAATEAQSDEKSVKGGEMRVASGVNKGRSINGDGTINMNSKTERERRVDAQNREAKKADAGESDQDAAGSGTEEKAAA